MSKRNITASILYGLLVLTVAGCASDCSNQRMTFREWISNRPRPLRDLLTRGDDCNTCNAPAGQLDSMGGYEMGGWDAYGSGLPGGGVGYYPSDIPTGAIPMHTTGRPGTDFAPGYDAGSSGSGKANAELELPPISYGRSGSGL